MMARINAKNLKGEDVQKDRKVLGYFVEEGMALNRSTRIFRGPRTEKMQRHFLSDLSVGRAEEKS